RPGVVPRPGRQIRCGVSVLTSERVPEAPLLEVLASVLASDMHGVIEIPRACTREAGVNRLNHHVGHPHPVGEVLDVWLAVDEGASVWLDARVDDLTQGFGRQRVAGSEWRGLPG